MSRQWRDWWDREKEYKANELRLFRVQYERFVKDRNSLVVDGQGGIKPFEVWAVEWRAGLERQGLPKRFDEPTSASEWLRWHDHVRHLGIEPPIVPYANFAAWSEKSHAKGYKVSRLVYDRFVKDRFESVMDGDRVKSFEEWMTDQTTRIERERGVPSAFLTDAVKPQLIRLDARSPERKSIFLWTGVEEWWELHPIIVGLLLSFSLFLVVIAAFVAVPILHEHGDLLSTCFIVAIFLEPIVIAVARRRDNWWVVSLLSVLFGWTGIGLLMA